MTVVAVQAAIDAALDTVRKFVNGKVGFALPDDPQTSGRRIAWQWHRVQECRP